MRRDLTPFSLAEPGAAIPEGVCGAAVRIPASGVGTFQAIARTIVWPADAPDAELSAIVPIAHKLCDLVTSAVLADGAARGENTFCAPGCNFCCGYVVAASGAEIDFLLTVLAGLPAAVREPAEAFWRDLQDELERKGITVLLDVAASRDEGWGALGDFLQTRGLTCPLLDGAGRCSIYAARPVTCREFYSLGPAARCIALDTPRLERPMSFNDVLVNLEARLGTREARMWELPTIAQHFDRTERPTFPPAHIAEPFAALVNKSPISD